MEVGSASGLSNCDVIATSVTALSNDAMGDGGGVYLSAIGAALVNVSVSAIDILLTNNTAQGSGGGIFMSASGSAVLDSTVSVDQVTAIGNSASGNGGGAFVQGSSTSSRGGALVSVSRVTATGNTAVNGGGLAIQLPSDVQSPSLCIGSYWSYTHEWTAIVDGAYLQAILLWGLHCRRVVGCTWRVEDSWSSAIQAS